jgi:hypothetical protein
VFNQVPTSAGVDTIKTLYKVCIFPQFVHTAEHLLVNGSPRSDPRHQGHPPMAATHSAEYLPHMVRTELAHVPGHQRCEWMEERGARFTVQGWGKADRCRQGEQGVQDVYKSISQYDIGFDTHTFPV